MKGNTSHNVLYTENLEWLVMGPKRWEGEKIIYYLCINNKICNIIWCAQKFVHEVSESCVSKWVFRDKWDWKNGRVYMQES